MTRRSWSAYSLSARVRVLKAPPCMWPHPSHSSHIALTSFPFSGCQFNTKLRRHPSAPATRCPQTTTPRATPARPRRTAGTNALSRPARNLHRREIGPHRRRGEELRGREAGDGGAPLGATPPNIRPTHRPSAPVTRRPGTPPARCLSSGNFSTVRPSQATPVPLNRPHQGPQG